MSIPAELLKRIKDNDPTLNIIHFENTEYNFPGQLKSAKALTLLKEALKGNTHVETLDLTRCLYGHRDHPELIADLIEGLKHTQIKYVNLTDNELFGKIHRQGGLAHIIRSFEGSTVKRLNLSRNKLSLHPSKSIVEILQSFKKTNIVTLDWDHQIAGGFDADGHRLDTDHLQSLAKGLIGTSISCLSLSDNGLGSIASVHPKRCMAFIRSLKNTALKTLDLSMNSLYLLESKHPKKDYFGDFILAFSETNINSLNVGGNILNERHMSCFLKNIPKTQIFEMPYIRATPEPISKEIFSQLDKILADKKKAYQLQQKIGFLFGLHKRVGKDSSLMAVKKSSFGPIFDTNALGLVFSYAFDEDAKLEKEKLAKKAIRDETNEGEDEPKDPKDKDLKERKETKEFKSTRSFKEF